MAQKAFIVAVVLVVTFSFCDVPVWVTAFAVVLAFSAYRSDGPRSPGVLLERSQKLLLQLRHWPLIWAAKHRECAKVSAGVAEEEAEEACGDPFLDADVSQARRLALCEAALRKGHSKLSNGDPSAARKHYLRAQKVIPNSVEPAAWSALASAAMGDFLGALRTGTIAVRSMPGGELHSRAHIARGIAYLGLNMPHSSSECFKQACETHARAIVSPVPEAGGWTGAWLQGPEEMREWTCMCKEAEEQVEKLAANAPGSAEEEREHFAGVKARARAGVLRGGGGCAQQ